MQVSPAYRPFLCKEKDNWCSCAKKIFQAQAAFEALCLVESLELD